MKLEDIQQQAEEFIRSGLRTEARTVLTALKGKQIPRAKLCAIATLCRRAGLFTLGIQLMTPVIRPKVIIAHEATAEENACYATLLLGIGANNEALELLKQSDERNPEVLLATAFTYINHWDYVSAIPYLKSYLAADVGEYQKLTAKVNLAAALVATANTFEGKPLLAEILETTQAHGWKLLQKNALELSAQAAIQEDDWSVADRLLGQAAGGSAQVFNLEDLFVEKWQAIAALKKNPESESAVAKLLDVRTKAARSNHWETVRDCDLRRALFQRNSELLAHVYFGTPHEKFRQRMEEDSREWFQIPDVYVRNTSDNPSTRIFDLHKAEEDDGKASLRPGKSLHKALQALTRDVYRPFLIGSLHNAIFPGEHFNTFSSPRRMSFLIHRMREWLKTSKIPLQIFVTDAGYQLLPTGDYAFRLRKFVAPAESDVPVHYLLMLEKIKAHWGSKPFSVSQVAEYIKISQRAARYFATWAADQNKIKKIGSGRTTRYQICR